MVTDVVDGDSLEAALRDYGPAAIEDLLPRLRAIAEILDAAHASGQVHGRLHPQNIFVSADQTQVHGLDVAAAEAEPPARPPYSAPEIAAGGAAHPAADQFSLAAIAFEWMFGRRITGPAVRPIEVRALPGVDRDALARAFTRALAPQPADRFRSCTAFCQALEGAVIPVLPLGGAVDEEDVLESGFLPEPGPSQPIDADLDIDAIEPAPAAASVPTTPEPRLESFEPRLSPPIEPVTSWQPSSAYAPAKVAESFSGAMLIVSCLVCMVVGFAAGYMARPRALQTGPIQTMAPPSNGTDGAVAAAPAPVDSRTSGVAQGKLEAPLAPTPAPKAPQALQAPENVGRLLIRSTPSGASVAVDGVTRGVTPLALRDLELGPRAIAITRRGYIGQDQRVVLTPARPSRTLEVQLAASAAAAEGRSGATARKPAGPAAGVTAAATTGGLLVESRPPGAAVTVNGDHRGTTPLTIEALAPGSYRIGLSLAGYQSFSTTVRVVAGERTRAAASLSVQE